jgi:hypothetical protein
MWKCGDRYNKESFGKVINRQEWIQIRALLGAENERG